MRVLVTGGAGYIGSVVTEELLNDGHTVTVLDDLSKGHAAAVPEHVPLIRASTTEMESLRKVLTERRIEAVIHMAASSLVSESVIEPSKYYRNNVIAMLSLLDAMQETGVHKLVFSSTAAVYGEPEKQPIEETDRTCPSNPYGETKLAMEKALGWFEAAYGIRYVCLRYFNAAGATARCGELHDPESHLIPLLLEVASGRRNFISLFGDDYPTRDGTCIRDYIHVIDLARAHVMALSILHERSATYNLGCGRDGYSVKEVIQCASRVTSKTIPVRVEPRRPGDPAVLIASSAKIAAELSWKPAHQNLEDIIGSAWTWVQSKSESYLENRS
jgi:UDP-glucose 4-epimerase